MDWRTIRRCVVLYNLAAILLAVALLAVVPKAQSADWRDWSWREAPAYTFTVEPYGGVRIIPASVCPFGISDLAATRGAREFAAPRVDTLAFVTLEGRKRSHLIVNGYHRTLRGWVWCG